MADLKYQQYSLSDFWDASNISGVITPQAYFRSDTQIPGVKKNVRWRALIGPVFLINELLTSSKARIPAVN